MLLEGQNNARAILQWTRDAASTSTSIDANDFRDRWGLIHARQMHPAFYDPERMQPSRMGVDYLLPIFTNAIGDDDVEACADLFDTGNLIRPYHSVNTDINKRIRYLDAV